MNTTSHKRFNQRTDHQECQRVTHPVDIQEDLEQIKDSEGKLINFVFVIFEFRFFSSEYNIFKS